MQTIAFQAEQKIQIVRINIIITYVYVYLGI